MLEFLIEDKYVCKDDRIAVGVSGGADSMLLLWALFDKQKEVGFYFEVININHHIRGDESDRDSEFVKNFCKSKNIPCSIVDVDVISLKKDNKQTLEESARQARYDVFKKIMKENKLNKLFLAHHKNDQAETILMHLFRGSGVSGVVGIKNTDTIIRPLINLKKSEILKLASDYGVKFVEDSTNSDIDYTRNFLRNVVIPDIEKKYPSVVDNICLFGKKMAEVQKFILEHIDEKNVIIEKNSVTILNDVFSLNKLVVREYIKRVFEEIGVFADIEAKHFEIVYEFFNCEINKELDLPHNSAVRKTYNGLKFYKKQNQNLNKNEYEFVKEGVIDFSGFGTIETKLIKPSNVVYGEGLIFVDATKISNKAVWRIRKPGDIFSKLGTGSKKLNDYFTDKKIDLDLRDSLPVLAVGNQILVVANNDVSENAKIDGKTDEIIMIKFVNK